MDPAEAAYYNNTPAGQSLMDEDVIQRQAEHLRLEETHHEHHNIMDSQTTHF